MGSKACCKPYCKAVVLTMIFVAVTARTAEFWGDSSSRRLPTVVPSLARLQQVRIRGGDMMLPRDLFANAVDVGEEKAKTGAPRVLMRSIMSGTQIALGVLMAIAVGGNLPGINGQNPGLQKLIFGLFGLPFGLLLVLVAGGELFTDNIMHISASWLESRATTLAMIRNWSVSYVGNFIGCLVVARLYLSAGLLGDAKIAIALASAKVSKPPLQLLLRGILGNSLACLAMYIAMGCSTLVEKMVAVLVPTTMLVVLGAEHSVANMAFVPLGIFSGANISWFDFVMNNLVPVTLGNIFGGVIVISGLFKSMYANNKPLSSSSLKTTK